MTAQERALHALCKSEPRWETLMTTEEADTYEGLYDHFADYISDLNIDLSTLVG